MQKNQKYVLLAPVQVSEFYDFYKLYIIYTFCILAGFYATQYILKTLPNARVDIMEKLPVPFGLVRQVHKFI